MYMYYILVFLGLACERIFEQRHGVRTPYDRPACSRIYDSIGTLVLCVASLVLLFTLRLALLDQAAHDPGIPQSHPLPAILAAADSPVLWSEPYRERISITLAFVAIASSIALYMLHRSLVARGIKPVDTVIIVSACGIIAIEALLAPALAADDPYLYAAYGELGLHAYATHSLSVPCPDLQAACEQRVMPSLYGPLYLSYLHILLKNGGSIASRIELLRLSNAAWLIVSFLILYRLGVTFPTLALAALNPTLWGEYVGDAHNDIIPAALIMAAALIARRRPPLALLLSIAASLIKLPFILIGTLSFLSLSGRRRLGWTAATLILSIVASLLWGGRAYIDSLRSYSQVNTLHIEQSFIAVVAIVLLALAFISRNIRLFGAYALPAFGGSLAHSWYVCWALPYLIWDRPKLTTFLIFLPMTSFILETPFQIPHLPIVLVCATTAFLLALLLRERRPVRGVIR